MDFNWSVILWTCITNVTLLAILFGIYYFYSARGMKRNRESFVSRLDSMKPGKEVLFSGGIRGKIVRCGEEDLDVEVAEGVVITVSKLAVIEVFSKKNK